MPQGSASLLSAENAQEERLEAHEWFDAEYDSVWNTSAPEEPSVPALVRGLHGKYSTPPSTSGCSGVKGQVRGASLPCSGTAYSSNEYRPTRVVWAANEINFPALSVMAWQYLGVPATSASAERLFSLAGRAFDDLRQKMKEEMLEILMWARINKEKRQRD
jgi:hypothetical protein